MAGTLTEQVISKIDHLYELYHRLMIISAPNGSGKTRALQEVHKQLKAPLINLNLEISRRMLDLTERQRAVQIPRLLGDMINTVKESIILIDNIEILFDVALKQDPLRLLQGLSRNHSIIVSWNGSIENGFLTYAVPGHPEYKRYQLHEGDFLVITPA